MKHTRAVGPCVAVLILSLLAPGLAVAQGLSVDGQRVVDYLLEDWQRQFSSTTIAHAMEWMGMPADDDLRIEVAVHLRAHDELARNLEWWGANNYIFTNLEKRVAKFLILEHERDSRVPTLAAAASALEVEPGALSERMAFMARAGFLTGSDSDLGYELAPGYKRWAGPLQHNFHTVFIEGEAPLDVW